MKEHDQIRNTKGFSVVFVMVIGIIASMTLMGLFSILMPSFQRATKTTTRTALRGISEASLDFACSQLSQTGGPTLLQDSGNTIGATSSSTVPMAVYAAGQTNSYSYRAVVTVSTIAAPQFSYLYNSNIPGAQWRLVTATASNGSISESLRAVLQPVLVAQQSSTTSTTFQPWTAGALSVGQSVTLSGQGSVLAYDSKTEAAWVATMQNNKNGVKSALQSASVYDPTGNNATDTFYKNGGPGSFNVSGADVNVLGSATSNNSATLSGQGQIGGNLNYATNVSYGTSGQANVDGIVSGSSSPSKFTAAPVHPNGATALAPISLSGQQTQTLSSGTYYIDSNSQAINISGQSSLLINANNGPVILYIEGNNPSITISGQGVSNPTGIPSNFIIYYGGSGSVTYSGQADLSGVIYAPNAPVTLSGQGNIWGAVVGQRATLSGQGSLFFDQELSKSNIMPIQTTTTQTTYTTNGYQVASWQVLTGN